MVLGMVALPALAQLPSGRGFETLGDPKQMPGSGAGSIPWNQHGAAAQSRYAPDDHSIRPTADGAELRCRAQRLAGRVTREGLWLTSTAADASSGGFRVVAQSVGRDNGPSVPLERTGKIATADSVARFIRTNLIEEYTVSEGGVQQDFMLTKRPPGAGELRVELAVDGAAATENPEGIRLTLQGSSRNLAYHRLRATDAAGNVLCTRMGVRSTGVIAVTLNDTGASYPIRIDPTFSDQDWVSLGAFWGYVNAMTYSPSGILFASGRTFGFDYAVAKWDGEFWQTVGTADQDIFALTFDANTNLYAGGSFATISNVAANCVAKWDGTTWSPLGLGTGSSVLALACNTNGTIYAGGSFVTAGGRPASSIARWNGSWSPLGAGTDNYVWSLAMDGDTLFVGGGFTHAGGKSAACFAIWRNEAWVTSTPGMSGGGSAILAMAVHPTDHILYVGGVFTNAGGVQANSIARWTGGSWIPLGTGMNNTVKALTFDSSCNLYAGGFFTTAGGVAASRIASWDGTNWFSIGSGIGTGLVNIVAVAADKGNQLAVGGLFNSAGGKPAQSAAKVSLPEAAIAIAFDGGPGVEDGGKINFGDVPVGTSLTKTFRVQSVGNAPLGNLSIILSGMTPDLFSINTGSLPSCIAPGESAVFSVTYTPRASGASTVDIKILSNALGPSNPFDLTLTAAGNTPPTDILLSRSSVSENQPINTVVGLLTVMDPDVGDIATFTLVAGSGDVDNTSFTIVGNELRTEDVFDFESKASYSIRVRASDRANGMVETNFLINIINVNEPPYQFAQVPTMYATPGVELTFIVDVFEDHEGPVHLLATNAPGSTWPVWLTFDPRGNRFYGTPSVEDIRTNTILLTATDTGTPPLSTSATFDVVVRPVPPLVTTLPATAIYSQGATLNGTVNPNGTATTVQFEYGTTTNYGQIVIANPFSISGTVPETVAASISNLTAGMSYHFRVRASNSAGVMPGGDLSFTTTNANRAPTLASISNPAPILEDAGLQTVPLSGISAGAGETQMLTVIASSSNTNLISHPAVSYVSPNTNGSLSYTPVANANGSAVISVVVRDNGGTANGGVDAVTNTFTVTVMPVNDAPSFTRGPNLTVAANAGPQTVSPWATGISPGPPDESGQLVNFLVTNTSNSLFSAQPAISPAGSLTYTPATSGAGTATVTVRLHDNGGTASGGVDTSAPQSFTITITAVTSPSNSPPVITFATNRVVVLEDSGASAIIAFASVSPGPPSESSQSITNISTTNNNPALFSAQPVVGTNGTLTFTPATNANGSATVTIIAQDNGGTANGGVNRATNSFTVVVTPVNDAPTLAAIPNPAPILKNAGLQTIPLSGISAGGGETQMLSVTVTSDNPSLIPDPAVSYANPTATGSLSYKPVTNATGTANISVVVRDNGGTANGGVDAVTKTFTVTVVGVCDPPTVLDLEPTDLSSYGITLGLSVNPNGSATTVAVEYGTNTSYGTVLDFPLVPDNGTNAIGVGVEIRGLLADTTYYYRIGATNGCGVTLVTNLFRTLPAGPGDLDRSFDARVAGGDFPAVRSTAVQPDGKVLVGGDFTMILGQPRNNIARLNADGTLDAGFNPNADLGVDCMVLQPDGKIIVAGAFSQIGGTARAKLVRLNPDGKVDTGFNPGELQRNGGDGGRVWTVLVLPDARILIGGDFTSVGGVTRNYLARLNSNGTLDTGFDARVDWDTFGSVHGLARYTDGRLVFGGGFTSVAGQRRNHLARMSASGVLDATYDPNVTAASAGDFASVDALAIQADGRVVIAGDFGMVGGVRRDRIARITTDGGLDAGFTAAIPESGGVSSLALQADGRIVVGGAFGWVNDQARNFAARLNSDGSLDSGFAPYLLDGSVSSVSLLKSGSILAGGDFRLADGLPRACLARLLNYPATESLTVPSAGHVQWLRGGASPEAQRVTFELSTDDGATWTLLGAGSRIPGGWVKTGLSLPASGLIRAQARVSGGLYNGSSGLVETRTNYSLGRLPVVVTGATTDRRVLSAVVHGTVNPNGLPTTAWFEYGLTTEYGFREDVMLAPDNGTTPQSVSSSLVWLQANTSYHYRLVASNAAGLVNGTDRVFKTLTNHAPTDIFISSTKVGENPFDGEIFLQFTVLDPDVGDWHEFELVDGPGDIDNWRFGITDNVLRANTSDIDFETTKFLTIRVRATDWGGLWVEKTFTLMVVDRNDKPVAIPQTVVVDPSVATTVTLAATDQDVPAQTLSFRITSLPGKGVLKDGSVTITNQDEGYDLSGRTVTYVANPGAIGVDTFAFAAYDGNDYSNEYFTPVTLILRGRQTINFPPLRDRVLGEPPFELHATASSGLPVSYAIVSGPATLTGNVLRLTGVGRVTVRATQGGNESYLPAPPVERSFNVVSPAIQTSGPLGAARYLHTATRLLDGTVLVVGGTNEMAALATAEVFNPAVGKWMAKGGMAVARYRHSATLLANGKVLVVGGTATGANLASAELYDPATGVWSATGALTAGRRNHEAVRLPDGRVLVMGGRGADGVLRTTEIYDPATGTWRPGLSMITARERFTAALLGDGTVLVAGGLGAGDVPLAGAEIYSPVMGTWSAAGSLAGARFGHTGTLLPDGRVLVAGGAGTAAGVALATAELYSPATRAWVTTATSLATARAYHSAVSLLDGRVLVVGGFNGTTVKSLEVYDVATGRWTAAGSLNVARRYATANLLDDRRVLIAGGQTSAGTTGTSELYVSVVGAFVADGSLNLARYSHTETLLPDGRVLVAGGVGKGAVILSAAETSDAEGEVWTQRGAMIQRRFGHAAALLGNGQVLVVGGKDVSSLASAERFDPVGGMWLTTGSLRTARRYLTATTLNDGRVLVTGGIDPAGKYPAATELYDPLTQVWSDGGVMAAGRFYHTATKLPDGRVLVVGGIGTAGRLRSAELFNPVSGAWTSAGNTSVAHERHTATLLTDGRVLVVGGFGDAGALTTVELFNPATTTWSVTGKLRMGRGAQTATLLASGRVLVTGGSGGNGVTLSSLVTAEVFNPAAGSWGLTGALVTPRHNHQAVLLTNGRVLVTGGLQAPPSSTLSSTELYFKP